MKLCLLPLKRKQFKLTVQVKYIQAIITGLEDHFPSVADLVAFSIFNPEKLPSTYPRRVCCIYGQDKLESLLTAYADGPNADVDHGECESEWEHFRILIQNTHI